MTARAPTRARAGAPATPRPSLFYLLFGGASVPLIRLAFRTSWRGTERLPPGGAVIASNHISNFDPWPLALGVFPGRYVRFMAKRELFREPLGTLMRWLGAFPIDRGSPDRAALATAVELARSGHVLIMFPEGTRRRKGLKKKHTAQAHSGAARIALRAGVPLVPAAVAGTERLSRLRPLRVAYGDPLELGDLEGMSRRDAAELATVRLMAAIDELEASLGRE